MAIERNLSKNLFQPSPVLDSLVIDKENDPNSKGTARRPVKMYTNELMAGRYETIPMLLLS